MKPILKILFNLLYLIRSILMQILGLLWYGKLMKVSPYHEQDKHFYSFYELFNDPLIQSKYVVHSNSKKDGAEEFLQELINNDKFREKIDKIKETYGENTRSILYEALKKYQQNLDK